MDQCHSTVGEKPVVKPRSFANTQVGTSGKAYWRSVEDLADTPEFRDWLEQEFPSGASRLLESSRRTFVKLMGASLALAGAATLPGCRRPDHKIMPYSREVPEEVIPGKPLYFATSIHLPGGSVEGLLVETHEHRPVKIEGNPLHATNRGKSSHWAQGCILGMYDPDRLKDPVLVSGGGNANANTPRSWADFAAWSKSHFAKFATSGGEGLAFLVDKRRGPTRDAIKAEIKKKYPKATWVAYDPIQSDSPAQATAATLGGPMREVLDLDKAEVIVSLDRDFLGDDPDRIRNMRGFSARRQVLTTKDAMSRIYSFESNYSITGAKADHRWAVPASAIGSYAAAIAKEVASRVHAGGEFPLAAELNAATATGNVAVNAAAVKAIAEDLMKARGKSVVVAGPTQSPLVHAIAIAINAALGNIGATVRYLPMGAEEATPTTALAGLVRDMAAGKIDTLVTIGANPVYDAPGLLDFAAAFAKVPHRLSASVDNNETVAASTWRLPMSHPLESWGDTEAWDGTIAPIQPMIAPLYGTLGDTEILLHIAGAASTDGYEFVRSVWKSKIKGDFEKTWRRALHDGVLADAAIDPASKPKMPEHGGEKLLAGLKQLFGGLKGGIGRMPDPTNMDIVFAVGMPGDGRFANHGWLQELPDPITKIVWDNVALVSPATAEKYDLRQQRDTDKHRGARMITVTVAGQKITLPAWKQSGIPDNTVVIQLGYGRKVCGLVGNEVGVNAFPISGNGDGSNRRIATGGTIERAGNSWWEISTTQMHGSMEGRAILREVDLPAWAKFGNDTLEEKDHYNQKKTLAFGERLGELNHSPALVNAYVGPQRNSKELVVPNTTEKNEVGNQPDFSKGPQWGMSIDLTTCTGCSACTIACQSENNIPIVGKIEVNKGREMHWIRVDRYFGGANNTDEDLGVTFQPVACVQCENAPCEVVCPVNATTHGPEGINYMVYNRCIGTRYCANNCPYKVRRFNFFQWGTKRYQGGYIGQETLESVGLSGPRNHNLIPARLREELNEIQKFQQNPDVTVRSRGVMEKCTYCIQRINEARIETKLRDLKHIPDGFFQTACQQSCPADAIAFGDIADKESRVSKLRDNARTYMLLGYLNTRPRTTYLAGIRNPNPVLATAEQKSHWDNPFGHGSEGGHEGDQIPEGKHALLGYDPSRTFNDRGYKMSLAVLGGKA